MVVDVNNKLIESFIDQIRVSGGISIVVLDERANRACLSIEADGLVMDIGIESELDDLIKGLQLAKQLWGATELGVVK